MRGSWGHAPKVYTRIRVRYFSAAKIRWAICTGLYVHVPPFRWLKSDRYASHTTALIFGWYFMIASGLMTSQVYLIVPLGFGPSGNGYRDALAGDHSAGDLLVLIMAANSLQVGLTIIYIMTNGFMTAVCVENEWSSYANHRKGLKGSSNKSHAQISTYSLQLPYRYSIPILVTFGILHWLVSQSLYLKDVVWIVHVNSKNKPRPSTTSVGYSPLASLIGLAILTALLIVIVVQGLWRVQADMPLLRSCSAVIAAACQPRREDAVDGAHLKKLQWGVMCEPVESYIGNVGHCGFSARYVGSPVEGAIYAW
jgi:hypothetical protein